MDEYKFRIENIYRVKEALCNAVGKISATTEKKASRIVTCGAGSYEDLFADTQLLYELANLLVALNDTEEIQEER